MSETKEKPARRQTAEAMGAKQRDISVSEFFTKNRHLLGFDNPHKSLLTTVKEAVDNSLDACEEAGILPELLIEITDLGAGGGAPAEGETKKVVPESRFRVVIEDNGPGIVKPQIPKIFAKLLYGSKFHRLRQSLTPEQMMLVERDGVVERVTIGGLCDSFMKGDGEDVIDVSHAKMRVPAFDPKTLEYAWRPVSHVIRHERANEVLEVRTQSGKRVRVTGCHSLFGYDPKTRRVSAVEARDLRAGDFIVAPRRIPAARGCDSIAPVRLELHASVACSQGRVPSFMFGTTSDVRQAFLRALYVGSTANGDVSTFSTSSEQLAGDVEALWLMQGVVATREMKGVAWTVAVRESEVASRVSNAVLAVGAEHEVTDTIAPFGLADVCFLKIESIEEVPCEDRYVYDISVPGCENFVAGDGLLACHNSRGQQGIGISAAGLYAQLTTGKPVVITSKTGKGRPAFRMGIRIDTKRNQPDIVKEEQIEWERDHGTRVEMELVAAYRGGRTGVQEYLEQTAVANPHLGLEFRPPKGEPLLFPRVSDVLPREPQEIKPHPHGVELGMLLTMLQDSPGKSVKQVLVSDFSRVSPAIADEICKLAGVKPNMKATDVHGDTIDRLHRALGQVKVMAPPATSVVPIGEELLIEGLKRRFPAAEFYISTTRPPSVYRGNPFVVEVGLAYGGELPGDEPADIMRFANRVPLQYQPKACAISESVYDTNWKAYNLPQPKGSLPVGPLAIVVHLASVWVPFTSEAKEAVAHYDELLREMKLALQECGRKLGTHLRARDKALGEQKRLSLFQRYIPEVAQAMSEILGSDKEKIEKSFYKALPNFVNVAGDDDDEGGGSPPPPAEGENKEAAPAAPAAKQKKSPPSKKKPEKPSKSPPPSSKKKRGEQLTLLH